MKKMNLAAVVMVAAMLSLPVMAQDDAASKVAKMSKKEMKAALIEYMQAEESANAVKAAAQAEADAAKAKAEAAQAKSDASMDQKAAEWVASLNLNDAVKTARVSAAIKEMKAAMIEYMQAEESANAVKAAAQAEADAAKAKAEAAQAKSDASMDQKAAEWVASLNLNDAAKAARVSAAIATQLKAVRDYHNAHAADIPDGAINPRTGDKLSGIERQVIADSGIPASVRENLFKVLNAELTPEQIEAILDKYTIGKVEFTMKAYREIFPNMSAEDEAVLYKNLKEARLRGIDFKNMNEISQIFEIYKTKNEQHFTNTGRDWRTYYKAYTDRLKAEKAAKAAADAKKK